MLIQLGRVGFDQYRGCLQAVDWVEQGLLGFTVTDFESRKPEWIANAVGHGSSFAIPLASVVGIPAYMNGYAAIPLISGLMEMGMTSGAAMAFITSGAVSSIPAALAVYALVRKPIFVMYIILGLTGSMLAGYIFQFSVGA